MVKLLTSVSGVGFAHGAGELVTLDKDFERKLIATGQAEPAKPARKVRVKSSGS